MKCPMRAHSALRACVLVCAAALLFGCATTARLPALPPQPGLADVHSLIRAHDAQDARYQVITDHAFLQVDLRERYRMQEYPQQGDPATKRAFIHEFVADAGNIANRSVEISLGKIPDDAIAGFAREHGVPTDQTPARDAVSAAVRLDQQQRLAAELAIVDGLTTDVALDHYWRELAGHVETSIMNRGRVARQLLTAPAVPFIEGWIAYHNWHDYRGPAVPDFRRSVVLAPAFRTDPPAAIGGDDWALLRHHAPMIVQEIGDGTSYPAAYDQFGTVSLDDGTAEPLPRVDSAAPAVYAFVDHKPLQGGSVRQLTYVLWYPQHPRAKRFDPEAGPLDGWTIRISLDDRDEPVVIESVSNCGCYYKIFPSGALEAKAAGSFSAPLAGKMFRVEQHQPDRFDAVVPETIPGLDGSAQNVVLYFSAAHHQLVTIRPHSALATNSTPASYALHSYDELEGLPWHGRPLGLFGEDGLVRAAHRGECNLLSPSGLYHAGHPRQRETQMIYFDEADFDDPQLLDRYLRLPPSAFRAQS
jgi:hypothetical protein